jgi:hypothetical protein
MYSSKWFAGVAIALGLLATAAAIKFLLTTPQPIHARSGGSDCDVVGKIPIVDGDPKLTNIDIHTLKSITSMKVPNVPVVPSKPDVAYPSSQPINVWFPGFAKRMPTNKCWSGTLVSPEQVMLDWRDSWNALPSVWTRASGIRISSDNLVATMGDSVVVDNGTLVDLYELWTSVTYIKRQSLHVTRSLSVFSNRDGNKKLIAVYVCATPAVVAARETKADVYCTIAVSITDNVFLVLDAAEESVASIVDFVTAVTAFYQVFVPTQRSK